MKWTNFKILVVTEDSETYLVIYNNLLIGPLTDDVVDQ